MLRINACTPGTDGQTQSWLKMTRMILLRWLQIGGQPLAAGGERQAMAGENDRDLI